MEARRQHRQSNILQSYARLFSLYERVAQVSCRSRPPSLGIRPSVVNHAAGYRPNAACYRPDGFGASRKGGKFLPKETWTHYFFCLADVDTDTPPTKCAKPCHQEAGLGRRKIVFEKRGNASHVKEKLEDTYPKLKQGGRFELLRSGGGPLPPCN